VASLWFSPGTLVSSTNKTDCQDILTEILLIAHLLTCNLNQDTYLFADHGNMSVICSNIDVNNRLSNILVDIQK
jgi:hypothetical protein